MNLCPICLKSKQENHICPPPEERLYLTRELDSITIENAIKEVVDLSDWHIELIIRKLRLRNMKRVKNDTESMGRKSSKTIRS